MSLVLVPHVSAQAEGYGAVFGLVLIAAYLFAVALKQSDLIAAEGTGFPPRAIPRDASARMWACAVAGIGVLMVALLVLGSIASH